MADGGSDEGAKGTAKGGSGKWFRIYVPSKGMESVAHFGKPGPNQYGYPGITFYTKSDFVTKTQHKIFLNSGGETIANAAGQMTLISKAAVNVVGEGAVNVGSPGSVVVASIMSGTGQAYQEVESGGKKVPTDKGHLGYLAKRHAFYESIKSLQSWATAIDASVEVAKAAMGFEVPAFNASALFSLGDVLGLVNKSFEAVKSWSELKKDSPEADGTSEGHDSGGQEEKKKPDYDLLDEVSKEDLEAAEAASTGEKKASEGVSGEKVMGVVGKLGDFKDPLEKLKIDESKLGNFSVKAVKVFGALAELNKLSKNIFGKNIFGEKDKKDDGGRVVVLAEQEMFTGVGAKQITVAAGGVEYWIPSLTDGFQVSAGGGISLKSGFKTEIFSIQAVAVEGLLGGELTSAGSVQLASRKRIASVLGPTVKVGSNSANIPTHSHDTKINQFQRNWSPMVQKPTKEILVETDAGGKIVIHIKDDKREVKMTDDDISIYFDPSKTKVLIDKKGMAVTTDEKFTVTAKKGIEFKTDDSIKGEAQKSALFRVGQSEMKVDKQNAMLKQSALQTQLSGGTNKHK